MADWIEHDGKGMPVDGETLVNVRFRDGWIDGMPTRAEYWHCEDSEFSSWLHSNALSDIVAYRHA